MIDKKSELDSGKYIAVTRYLETLVQSNQNNCSVRLCLTWNFIKNGASKTKLIFVNSLAQRHKMNAYQVQNFKNKALKLFFISLKAGGVGLNITKASYVLFWTRGGIPEKQGIGRASYWTVEQK
jgi:non-specific serine/threonine protein kinase